MAGSAWISSAHIPEVHHTVTLIAMEAGTGKQSPETKVPKPQHNMCPMLCLLVAWTPPQSREFSLPVTFLLPLPSIPLCPARPAESISPPALGGSSQNLAFLQVLAYKLHIWSMPFPPSWLFKFLSHPQCLDEILCLPESFCKSHCLHCP